MILVLVVSNLYQDKRTSFKDFWFIYLLHDEAKTKRLATASRSNTSVIMHIKIIFTSSLSVVIDQTK